MAVGARQARGARVAILIALAGCAYVGPPQTGGIPNYEVPLHGRGDFAQGSAGRIYYEVEGHGPALMLVAGGPGGSHAGFHPWFSRLAAHHTLIYVDNLGRGHSDRAKNPAQYTLAQDVADLEAVRAAVGVEKMAVLGQSYGGMPALGYALAHPEHVNALVLSDTLLDATAFQGNINGVNAYLQKHAPQTWAQLEAMRAQGIPSSDPRYDALFEPKIWPLYWHDLAMADRRFRSGDPADELSREVYDAMVGMDPERTISGTLAGYDPRSQLAQMHTPTLICVGRDDRITPPAFALEILRTLPPGVGRLRVFESSAHWPWIEESEAYFETLNGFLDAQP